MRVACIIEQDKTFKAGIIVLDLKSTFSTDIVTKPYNQLLLSMEKKVMMDDCL
jgi:hypothetical protein